MSHVDETTKHLEALADASYDAGLRFGIKEYPTLRDRFAMAALQALISQGAEARILTPEGVLIVPMRQAAPKLAYEYADAMLAQRSKPTT